VTSVVVAPTYEPIGQVLTAAEYDALPENPRRELVDGVVHVMATPTPWHQDVVDGLKAILARLVPRGLRVTREIEVRLDELVRRNPDVLVVRTDGFRPRVAWLRPDQVVLATEVVSPGSESTDRDVKPRQYARAGIPFYWRIETDPVVEVHTYQLGVGSTYLYTGAFSEGEAVDGDITGLEWATFDVSDVTSDPNDLPAELAAE